MDKIIVLYIYIDNQRLSIYDFIIYLHADNCFFFNALFL